MGGLSHYLETEGLATTGISLIRPHTEKEKPPRALWVPFPLGRPFGAPNDPELQMRVLRATLGLLERGAGPVLEDFPDDGPMSADEDEDAWACPLPLPSPPEPADEREAFAQQLAAEIGRLKTWHEQAVRKQGRSGFGASGLRPERVDDLAALIAAAAFDVIGETPEGGAVPMPALLHFAADDLRAFYMEAAAAQPASRVPGPDDLARWLYGNTVLGDALYMARDALVAHEDDRALQTQGRFMVPGAYNRKPERS